MSFDGGAVNRMSGTFSRLSESTNSARLTELSENNFSREVATRMADSLLFLRGFGWRVGLSALLLLCHATQGSSFEQDIDSSAVSVLHVQGVVLNALTNKPISRVLVTAMDAATMTDSDGRFEFRLRSSTGNGLGSMSGLNNRDIVNGGISVEVMARRPGYIGTYQPPTLMFPDKNSDPPELEIKLIPEAILRGRITTPAPTPPAGVAVLLLRRQIQDGVARWTPVVGALSNSRGEYRIADLPAGDYKVMTGEWIPNASSIPAPGTQMTGYPPTYYPNEATPFHIAAGEIVQADLNLRAEPYYRVTIPIANAKNGVSVEVMNQSGSSRLSLGFNPQSQMIEGFLPNGTYSVRVTFFGPILGAGSGAIDVAGGPTQGSPISPTPGGIIPVIVHEAYTANSGGSMPVVVGGTSGENRPSRPLNLTLVLQLSQGNGLTATLRPPLAKGTDDLVIENVWEGKYRLYLTPFRGYVASATSNGVDLLRNLLVVGANRTSAPIEITLRDDTASLDGTISANIAGEDGQKTNQKRLFVHCIPLDNEFGGQVQTAGVADGKFSFQNLPPGQYLVFASGDYAPNLEYRNEDVLRQYESDGTVVTLKPGQKGMIAVSKIIEDKE